jgi:hypothetical protein
MGLNVTFRRIALFFTRRVHSPSQLCLFSLFLKDNPFTIACDYSLNNFADINSISDKPHHYHRRLKPTYAIFSTYLLTPWCRVLLEKLTGLQLVKKSPAFHGTRRFITALTSVRHLSLSWARPIQSIYPHPTSWRSILILSTHLRLGLHSVLFPSGFPTKSLYIFSTAL